MGAAPTRRSVSPVTTPRVATDIEDFVPPTVDACRMYPAAALAAEAQNDSPIAHLHPFTMSADDIIPLYVYILVHANIPSLFIAREFVARLGDDTEVSERSYYFTLFSSAVEYIMGCGSDLGMSSPTLSLDAGSASPTGGATDGATVQSNSLPSSIRTADLEEASGSPGPAEPPPAT